MTDDLAGNMVMTFSIWHDNNLDWLQHGQCEDTCTLDAQHIVSNITIRSAEYKAQLAAEAFWNGEAQEDYVFPGDVAEIDTV